MSTQRRADMCTTHHHACDCREFAHAQEIEHLRAELAALRARIGGAAAEHVRLDERGCTVILPPIEWECGRRVALVPLDD